MMLLKRLIFSIVGIICLSTPLYATTSTGSCFGTDTVLMLHANGADTSTTFTDDSDSAHTVTANNNAQLDTAQQKFGTASGLFDGTDDYLSTADSADWDFDSGDWTVDFWVRFNSVAITQRFISQWETGDLNWNIGWLNSNNLAFIYSTDGTTVANTFTFAWTPSTATWYHVAVVRSGADLEAFIDGTQIGITENVSTDAFFDATVSLLIGVNTTGLLNDFDGWLDEIRVVKGTAVWTTNFTAPSAEYTACAASARNRLI